MSGLFLNAVVAGVFHQCRTCKRWYRTGCFNRKARCSQCYRSAIALHTGHRNRSYALTDKARELLAAERPVA